MIFQTFFSRSSKLIPVIVIDYNSFSFEPIALLRDLKTTKNLNISECVWQLGDNRVASISKKYSDDLKTLKILCESVNKEHNLNWNVAADSSLRNEALPFDIAGYNLMK